MHNTGQRHNTGRTRARREPNTRGALQKGPKNNVGGKQNEKKQNVLHSETFWPSAHHVLTTCPSLRPDRTPARSDSEGSFRCFLHFFKIMPFFLIMLNINCIKYHTKCIKRSTNSDNDQAPCWSFQTWLIETRHAHPPPDMCECDLPRTSRWLQCLEGNLETLSPYRYFFIDYNSLLQFKKKTKTKTVVRRINSQSHSRLFLPVINYDNGS